MSPPADSGSNTEDVELMRLFQGGDETAFDRLVSRHMTFVVRHARRYLGDANGAEDVAQEVFLRLFRSRDMFRDGRNFGGWLATITSRLALNELRTRRRKHWLPASTLGDGNVGREWRSGEPEVPEPAAEALRRERIDAVHQALARLPERQREALVLQRFEGWDLTSVGEALGLSVPAVKSLLFRARAALAKELEAYLNDRKPMSPGRAS